MVQKKEAAVVETSVLSLRGVRKSFGKNAVLRGADLHLQKGEICGLLGPNGSGKTTLLKIITGLLRPDDGVVKLFGRERPHPSALRRCGCLVDNPRIYPAMTARENLRLHQLLLGLPDDKTGEILELVALRSEGDKKARRLSRGTKQRLSLGMALMGSPDLLLLDEPLSNLDPRGIYEMRQVLFALNKESGVSILLSSHQIGELEKLCHSYAILNKGVIKTLPKSEIQERSRQFVQLVTDNSQRAAVVLDRFLQGEPGYEVMPDGSIKLFEALDRVAELNAALVQNGVLVYSITQKSLSVEQFFLDEVEGGGGYA